MKQFFLNYWNSKFYLSLTILIFQLFTLADMLIIVELSKQGIQPFDSGMIFILDIFVSLLLTILNLRFMFYFWRGYKFAIYCFLIVIGIIMQGYAFSFTEEDLTNYSAKLFMVLALIIGYIPPVTAFIYILIDSLRETKNKVYRLIGAANIFILFPSLFAGLFYVLHLIHPDLSGMNLGSPMEAIYFYTKISYYGATGFDLPLSNPDILLRNAVTVESFFMNLFTLLMIGRLVEK